MFKTGDKVRCVKPGNYVQLERNKIYTVDEMDDSPSNLMPYVRIKGILGGWDTSRFEKVEDDTPIDMNDFLSKKANELTFAIDNGTMVGYYSALGFLVQTLQELSTYQS